MSLTPTGPNVSRRRELSVFDVLREVKVGTADVEAGQRLRPLTPSPAAPWHVLVVEGDTNSAESLMQDLRRQGHSASRVSTGAAALRTVQGADIMLLGFELPDMDGVEVCRGIRATCDLPVIICAGSGSELDCVLGLQAGADDYVVKPYGFRELLARMEAVMRRAARPGPPAAPQMLTHGPLTIDTGTRTALLHGRELPLTRKEFDLLRLLAAESDRVASRRQILRQVWHDTDTTRSRTIDTHINSLRRKLGSSEWIVTVRGVGFRLGTCDQGGSW